MNCIDSETKYTTAHLFVGKRTKKNCVEFLGQIKDNCYEQILEIYLKEQKQIPDGVEGSKQREEWLHNLWEVDTEQAGYQILALLIGK